MPLAARFWPANIATCLRLLRKEIVAKQLHRIAASALYLDLWLAGEEIFPLLSGGRSLPGSVLTISQQSSSVWGNQQPGVVGRYRMCFVVNLIAFFSRKRVSTPAWKPAFLQIFSVVTSWKCSWEVQVFVTSRRKSKKTAIFDLWF